MFTVYNAHTGRQVSRHRLEERARKAADEHRQEAVVVSDQEEEIIRVESIDPWDRSREDWIVLMTEIERIAALPYPEDTAGHFHEDLVPLAERLVRQNVGERVPPAEHPKPYQRAEPR